MILKTLAGTTFSLAVLVVGSAIPASADTGDSAFIEDISGTTLTDVRGVPLKPNPQRSLLNGRVVCSHLAAGETVGDVITTMSVYTELSMDSAAFLARTAINDLCPGNWPD